MQPNSPDAATPALLRSLGVAFAAVASSLFGLGVSLRFSCVPEANPGPPLTIGCEYPYGTYAIFALYGAFVAAVISASLFLDSRRPSPSSAEQRDRRAVLVLAIVAIGVVLGVAMLLFHVG